MKSIFLFQPRTLNKKTIGLGMRRTSHKAMMKTDERDRGERFIWIGLRLYRKMFA